MIVEEHTKRNIVARVAEFPHPGASDLHWHENCEICVPLDNGAIFLIDGETVEAKVGDILFIDGYVPHQITFIAPKTHIIIVHMRLSCFIEQGIRLEHIKPHIKKEEIDAIPMLEEKISFILKLLYSEAPIVEKPRENPFLYSTAASLYFLLMRHFNLSEHTPPQNADREVFYSITEYINRNFREDITVSSISSALFISKRKLSEIFRKFAGTGISGYITAIRIKNANYLLMQGKGIAEAAYESGFQNLRTFNNAYKIQMLISPSEYIKRGGDISAGEFMQP